MITDIFAHRYEGVLHFSQHHAERVFRPIFMQAAHILFEDIQPTLNLKDDFFQEVSRRLARELGLPALRLEQTNQLQICAAYLVQPYNLWDNSHGNADYFVKTRLSLLELLFRNAEDIARQRILALSKPRGLIGRMFGDDSPQSANNIRSTVAAAIEELNSRFRTSGVELIYHNGLVHLSTDDLASERLAKPFWNIVADERWAVVNGEMKEAVDRLDRGQSDSIIYATKALESTLKIISDKNGWSTGKEGSAISYIENLQSERSGRYIAPWEADALKAIFRDLRNPHSHGGGSLPPDRLVDAQRAWVLDTCMAWIKSLVRRQSSKP